MHGMGELQVLFGTSLPEEVTSGNVSSQIVVPCEMQVEAWGIVPVTKFGNTITTATGIAIQRVTGTALGTATQQGDLLVLSAGSTVDLDVKFGDGATYPRAAQTAILGTHAWDVGECIVKKLSSPFQCKAGERIRFCGSTTVGSATGDFIPFVLVRVAGIDLTATNVATDETGT